MGNHFPHPNAWDSLRHSRLAIWPLPHGGQELLPQNLFLWHSQKHQTQWCRNLPLSQNRLQELQIHQRQDSLDHIPLLFREYALTAQHRHFLKTDAKQMTRLPHRHHSLQ